MPSHLRTERARPAPEFPHLALSSTSLGGVAVRAGGRLLGWMHENRGRWNAYLPVPGESLGRAIGTFPTRDEAVRRIVEAGPPSHP